MANTVNFFQPKLVVKNITSNKDVRVLDVCTLHPGQVADVFTLVEVPFSEDQILKALYIPNGDLYQEVFIKHSLEILEFSLPSFNYSQENGLRFVRPPDLQSTNSFSADAFPVAVDADLFKWISFLHPLVILGDQVQIPPASATTDGYLTKEDWVMFSGGGGGGTLPGLRIWQYQDFTAPVATTLSITAFENGSGLAFNPSYIVNNTASIVLVSDTEQPPTTSISIPGKYLPSNKVLVTSQIGTTVILNQAPHASLSCRVFYQIDVPLGSSPPAGYEEDPSFVNEKELDFLDADFVNQAGDETIYGVKTFEDVVTANIKLTTSPVDGYALISDASGIGAWSPVEVVTAVPATGRGTSTDPVTVRIASGSQSGALSAADWSTFSSKESVLTFVSPVTRTVNSISIPLATSTADGYLSGSDRALFAAKESALSFTTPLMRAANTISVPVSSSITDGYLSANDFTIFAAKESVLTFSSPLARATNAISLPISTNAVDGYLSAADHTIFAAKESALTFSAPLSRATNNISMPPASSSADGYVTTGSQTFAGPKTLASTLTVGTDGTALLPAIIFSSPADSDTGIWHPSANTVAISTGGTERLRITSDGYVSATSAGFKWPDGTPLTTLTASGQLSGVYPSPNVIGIRETGGPQNLSIGAIAANEMLARDNSNQIISTGFFHDPAYGTQLFDDFQNASTSFGNTGWSFGSAGAGATGGQDSVHLVDGNHPGIGFINAGTTSTGRAAYSLQQEGILFGGGVCSYETLIYIPVSSVVADEFILRIGFNDTQGGTNADAVDGAYFVYDRLGSGTSWQARTANSSSRTTTNTGVTVAIATWIKLKIVVNAAATSVEFFVNGVSVATIITNIPKTSLRQTGLIYRIDKTASSGGSTAALYFDYMLFKYQFTTPR